MASDVGTSVITFMFVNTVVGPDEQLVCVCNNLTVHSDVSMERFL